MISDEEKKRIERYFNDAENLELEWALIRALPIEKQNQYENQATELIALKRGVSIEQMREDLGESGRSGQRYHSIWGGKKAQLFKDIALKEVSRLIEKSKKIITVSVCVKFKYCKKRNNRQFQNENFTLAIAVADSLLAIAASIPFPVILVSSYVIKKGILDKWCNCT